MAAGNSMKMLSDIIKVFSSKNGYDSWFNKVKVVEGGEGRCVCEMKVDDEHLNRGGAIHGGCLASLVDMVSTLALMTSSKPVPGVSVELSVSYLNAAFKGEDILIDASTLKAGRTLAFLAVEIKRKEDGRMIATGKHTKFIGESQKDHRIDKPQL